jgi:membrane protease YdiL (CAAX protease family)
MTTREQDLVQDADQCEPAQTLPKPYGFWGTMGLSLVVLLVYVGATVLGVFGFAVYEMARQPRSQWQSVIENIELNGLVLLTSVGISGLLGLALTLLFARLRKGLSVRDYLCLRGFRIKAFIGWLAVVLVFLGLYQALAHLVKPGDFSAEYLKLYETAVYPALFWVAIVVVAPVFEETFFRGFMYRGIEASRLGTPGAVVITALVWSVIHVQYDLTVVVVLFGLGVLFGLARARHRSVPLTIGLHMAVNLIATVGIAFSTTA